jgi:hypothetical protein
MRVTDVDSFVKNLKEAGVKVASVGEEPITLNNNNVKTCILSDPNNFFFQLMAAPPPRQP